MLDGDTHPRPAHHPHCLLQLAGKLRDAADFSADQLLASHHPVAITLPALTQACHSLVTALSEPITTGHPLSLFCLSPAVDVLYPLLEPGLQPGRPGWGDQGQGCLCGTCAWKGRGHGYSYHADTSRRGLIAHACIQGLSVAYLVLFSPGSYLCWFQTLYTAFRKVSLGTCLLPTASLLFCTSSLQSLAVTPSFLVSC